MTNEQQEIVNHLRYLLREGEARFKYKKLSGEVREARGTLKMDMIPEESHPSSGKTTAPDTVNYYDLDKNAWRSFKTENLLSILNHDN